MQNLKSLLVNNNSTIEEEKDIKVITMKNRVKVQLNKELSFLGLHRIAREVLMSDFEHYEGGKHEVLATAVQELIDRYPRFRKRLENAQRYVDWLLDDTYVWFE